MLPSTGRRVFCRHIVPNRVRASRLLVSSNTVATTPIPIERITSAILVFRGQRVLLDATLATMYSVKTKGLNQAVRRNRKRFPTDFMFQLSAAEAASLRSQTVTSNARGGRRSRPYVFT
jgi:hypothetical protein